jgi:hypothetical protein
MSKKITITEDQAKAGYQFENDLWRFLHELKDGEGIHIAPINAYAKKSNGVVRFFNKDGKRSINTTFELLAKVREFYNDEYKVDGKYETPADAEEVTVPRRATLYAYVQGKQYLYELRKVLGSLAVGGKAVVTVYARYGKRKAPITIERTEDGYVLKHKSYSFTAEKRWPVVKKALERAKTRPSVA